MSININDLTIGEVKEIAAMTGCGSPAKGCPVSVGEKVFIRTVTYHQLGRVEEIRGAWVRLSGAAWVASSGRWAKAIQTGELDEVEVPGCDAWVNLDAAVDIHPWAHDLPTETI